MDALSNTTDPTPHATLTSIPGFSDKLYALVSQPPYSDQSDPGNEKHVNERDRIFVQIVLRLAGENMEAWINDSQNQAVARHWARAAERCNLGHPNVP